MVHVQPRLASVCIGGMAHVTMVVMVTVAVVVVMVMMVAVPMMHMTRSAIVVHVQQEARERTDRRGKGHAYAWRQGEHRRHRPNQGDAASACSVQVRQHVGKDYHAEATVWQTNQRCHRFLPNPGRAGQDFCARIGVLASTQAGSYLYLDGLRKLDCGKE